MIKNVIILRGVSGASKTTFAEYIRDLYGRGINASSSDSDDCAICTADDFFYDKEGEYKFDATKLKYAHEACKNKFDAALNKGIELIIVANTNTKKSDFSYYIDKARIMNYRVFVMVMENYHGNRDIHGVPEMTREIQEKNIKESLKLR